MKSGAKAVKEIVEVVAPIIPVGESWDTFSMNWDIMMKPSGEIVVIKPETDINFIETTCLKKHICESSKIPFVGSDREDNVIDIVEMNMLSNMNWVDYNRTWSVSMDYDIKRITTRLFKTVVNEVKFPEPDPIPEEVVPMQVEATPMSDEEISRFLKKTRNK